MPPSDMVGCQSSWGAACCGGPLTPLQLQAHPNGTAAMLQRLQATMFETPSSSPRRSRPAPLGVRGDLARGASQPSPGETPESEPHVQTKPVFSLLPWKQIQARARCLLPGTPRPWRPQVLLAQPAGVSASKRLRSTALPRVNRGMGPASGTAHGAASVRSDGEHRKPGCKSGLA